MNETGERLYQAISVNMRTAIDQDAYHREFEQLEREYEEQKTQYERAADRLKAAEEDRRVKLKGGMEVRSGLGK